MPTGLPQANFQNKQLVGYQDLGERGFEYLKLSHEDATQARFDQDGAVAAIIDGTPNGNDTLEFGTGKATDGIGHIFDFTQLGVGERTVVFPNQVGITYYWAAAYAQEARGIRVSPRTGAPQYVSFVDTIGELGQPNSVVDNGNGTITLTVNSVTEAAVDHTGKEVAVWMVIPQSASEAVAIEVATVVFGGGNNTITTAGDFGQTVVSTNPVHYVVLARGVSFRTNPFPTGFFNLGTVLGNGPPAVPNALDTTTQRLLKTFQDASQIAFTPYKWIASVDIQNAIEELIDDLEEHTTATAGAIRIGVNPNDFSDKATQANHESAFAKGGVGTISDGTFTSTAERQLDRTLAEIDRTLRNRYTHLTYGTLPDSDDTTGLPSFGARQYHIRPKGLSPGYVVGATDENAKVVGEQGDVQKGTPQRLDLLGAVASTADLMGEFERVLLTTNNGALGQEIFSDRSLWLRKCGVELGGIHFSNDGNESFRHIADCDFHEPAGLVEHAGVYGVRFSDGFANSPTQFIVERTIFRGSTSSSRTEGDLHFTSFGDNDTERRPLVFRDCTFLQGRADIPILTNGSEMFNAVLFENCVFISTNDHTASLVDGTSCAFKFKDCFFYARNGDAIRMRRARRSSLIDCYIKTGDHADANPIANPQILAFSGSTNTVGPMPSIRNLSVEIGRAVPTATGGVGLNPLVRIGDLDDASSGHGPIQVDGVYIQYTSNAATLVGMHQVATLLFDYQTTVGTTPGQQGISINDVIIDLNNAVRADEDSGLLGGATCLGIYGHGDDAPIQARNIHIIRAQQAAGSFGTTWIEIDDNVHLDGGSMGPFNNSTPTPAFINGNVRIGDSCRISRFGIRMECPEGQQGPAFSHVGRSSSCDHCDVHFLNTSADTVYMPYFVNYQVGSHSTEFCEFFTEYGEDLADGTVCNTDLGSFIGNKFILLEAVPAGSWVPMQAGGDNWRVIGNHTRSATAGVWISVSGDNSIIANNQVQAASFADDTGSGNVFTDNMFGAAALWP